MRKILFIIPFFLWTCGGGSSPTSSNDNDGDDGDDGNSGIGPITIGIAISLPQGYEVKEAYDGGYIIAAGSFGTSNENMYLIKTDASGNEEWSKSFRKSAGLSDWFNSVKETSDGGYITVGYTTTPGPYYDMYVVKTDASGNEMWSRTFGGSRDDGAYSVDTTSDGGFIIMGETTSYTLTGRKIYLVKIDSEGNQIF
jgi:hypothetical protein